METTAILPLTRQHTVVIVDDDPNILRAVSRVLGREPYETLATARPDQALEWVRERDVSLVIADERMPFMSGTELLDAVHRISPETSRVILTGYAGSDSIRKGLAHDIEWLISKPWNDLALQMTVRELLQKREGEKGKVEEKGCGVPEYPPPTPPRGHCGFGLLEADSSKVAAETLSKILRGGPPSPDRASEALRELAGASDFQAGFVWLALSENGPLGLAASWYGPSEAAGLVAASEDVKLSRGEDLPGSAWTTAGPAWVGDLAQTMPSLRSAEATKAGFRSAVALPLTRDGAFLGVLELYARGARPLEGENLDSLSASGVEIAAYLRELRRAGESSDFEAFLQAGLGGISFIDRDGRFLALHPTHAEGWGRPAETSIGTLWIDLLHPADRVPAETALREMVSSGHALCQARLGPDAQTPPSRWFLVQGMNGRANWIASAPGEVTSAVKGRT
jgi:CheY-like chemotaxis protein